MSPEFTQKNSSLGAVFFNSLSREKSTQDEKVHFIKGNKLKLTQVELLSFFIFKSVKITVLFELLS